MKRVQMDKGPIPKKYRELIGAGISAISKCRYSAYRPASGHRHQIIPQIYRKVFVTNGRIAVCFGAIDATSRKVERQLFTVRNKATNRIRFNWCVG